MKIRQSARITALLLGLTFLLLGFGYGAAQGATRSVRGQVINAGGDPISGAIVYLTDSHTMSVVSYITQQDGKFRFEQLSPHDDYKIWAKVQGKKSATRIISSFDSRRIFHILLKIGKTK